MNHWPDEAGSPFECHFVKCVILVKCEILVMVTQLHLGVILSVFSAVLAQKDISDIKVTCLEKSVSIKWRISAEFEPDAGRFFLGNCKFSTFGKGELRFDYRFNECNFKQQINGKHMIFDNELAFRPQQRGSPPDFVYPIQCVTKGSDIWVPHFLNPGAGSSEARGGLLFQMALLNAELTDISQNNVVPLGSVMPIWATVDQKSHQPLLLLMEECIAASTPELSAGSQVYPLITNKGCLVESKKGNAFFLPRYQSSSIILYLQSFQFGLGQEVYIHCKLVAWDPDHIDVTKKACYYSKAHERWVSLDRPDKSSVCSCCASNCKARSRRYADESGGLSSIFVLGPLIVDQSDLKAQDTQTGYSSTAV